MQIRFSAEMRPLINKGTFIVKKKGIQITPELEANTWHYLFILWLNAHRRVSFLLTGASQQILGGEVDLSFNQKVPLETLERWFKTIVVLFFFIDKNADFF